ncbi:MAG: hypothetical protein ACK5XN_32750, partial [Bacteroidota bacterium]
SYLAYYEKKDVNLKKFSFFICEHKYNNFSIYRSECFCNEDFKIIEIPYTETKEKVIFGGENKMITGIKQHDGFFECFPITGIRHQIRLTMSYLGFPIIGDELYGKKEEKMMLFSTFIGIHE